MSQTSQHQPNTSQIVQFAIAFLFVIFSCGELFNNWMYNPKEKGVWIMFVVWLVPVFWYHLSNLSKGKVGNWNIYPIYLSLFFCLVGIIGSFNTSAYLGLVLIFLALLPWRWGLLIWLFSAAMWMPAVGWVSAWYFHEYAYIGRLIVVLSGVVSALYFLCLERERGCENEK